MFVLALVTLLPSAHADFELPTRDSVLDLFDRDEKSCTERGMDIALLYEQAEYYWDLYTSSRMELVRKHSLLHLVAYSNATCRAVSQAYAEGCAANVPAEAAEFCGR